LLKAITLSSPVLLNPEMLMNRPNPKIQLDDKTGLGFNERSVRAGLKLDKPKRQFKMAR